MIALVYEILALVNLVLANLYHYQKDNDVNTVFCMLIAILMAIMSIKYDKGE